MTLIVKDTKTYLHIQIFLCLQKQLLAIRRNIKDDKDEVLMWVNFLLTMKEEMAQMTLLTNYYNRRLEKAWERYL